MSQEIEEMAAFFDKRAEGYEEHMRSFLDMDGFYGAVAGAFSESEERLNILDLGCGTGLEMGYLFQRMPNARITGIDLAGEMLNQLRHTYRERMDQITLTQESYVTHPLRGPLRLRRVGPEPASFSPRGEDGDLPQNT